MPDPLDLKVLVKQVLTDPKGLNLPTLPSTAMIIGNAIGDKGNWTAVYGHSERSIAIFGESSVFAGFFQGDVHITGKLESGDARIAGNLIVTGDLNVHGRSINQVLQQFDALKSQLQQLQQRLSELAAPGPTNFGAPINSPVTRPNLAVRQLRREELAADEPSEARFFEVQGSGFLRGTSVVIRFFNGTSPNHNDLEGPNFPPRHSVVSDLNGAISLRGVQIRCRPGDQLQVAASDGRGDLNDHSSTLWSNSLFIKVE